MKPGSIAMMAIMFAAALTFFGTAFAATSPQDRLVMGKIVKDGQVYALQTPTGRYVIEGIDPAAWQGAAVDVVGVPHGEIPYKTIDTVKVDPSLYAQNFNPGISIH
jgi:hypothetical protein